MSDDNRQTHTKGNSTVCVFSPEAMAELEMAPKCLTDHLTALTAVSMLHLRIRTHKQRGLFPKSVLIFRLTYCDKCI